MVKSPVKTVELTRYELLIIMKAMSSANHSREDEEAAWDLAIKLMNIIKSDWPEIIRETKLDR